MPNLPNGQKVSDDAYRKYWADVFKADPEMQRIYQDSLAKQKDPSRVTAFNWRDPNIEAAQQRARALGYVPPDHDWSLASTKSGYLPGHQGYVERNMNWIAPALIAPVAIGGGLAAAGALSGGGAAATPSLGSAVGATGSVPTSLTAGGATSLAAAPAAAGSTAAVAGTAPALGGIGGAVGGTAPALGTVGGGYGATGMATAPAAAGGAGSTAATAAGLGSNVYKKALFGIGGDLLNGYLNNRSANKAADELNKAGDKQIAAYDKALGPYMDPAPLNALKFLSGLPAGGGQAPSATPMATPFDTNRLDNATTGRTAPEGAQFSPGMAVPRTGTLSSLVPQAQRQQAQQQTASSFVRMVSPDGEEGDVHPSQVQSAIQAGARPLQAAMGRG